MTSQTTLDETINKVFQDLNEELHVPQEINPDVFSQTYYRAKSFTCQIGVTRLTAAASPLLALIPRLAETETQTDIHGLYVGLRHELKAFESALSRYGYNTDVTLLARYAICATLDETIRHTQWGKEQQWDKYTLLKTLCHEKTENDRFFTILQKTLSSPEEYHDLLVLFYICLSLGYKGSFRNKPDGEEKIALVASQIYQRLNASNPLTSRTPSQKKEKPLFQKSMLIKIFAFTLLVALFGFFVTTSMTLSNLQEVTQYVSKIPLLSQYQEI